MIDSRQFVRGVKRECSIIYVFLKKIYRNKTHTMYFFLFKRKIVEDLSVCIIIIKIIYVYLYSHKFLIYIFDVIYFDNETLDF